MISLPPIYLNTVLIKDLPLHTKIRLAAENGFDGIEMWVNDSAPQLLTLDDRQLALERYEWDCKSTYENPDSTVEALQDNKLVFDGIIPGMDILQRWSEGLDEELLESIGRTFKICALLGGRYVVLPILAEQGSLASIASNLSEIASLAAENNVQIGLEPIGHAQLFNSVKDALAVLEAADTGGTAGIVLDSFHYFRAGQELSDLRLLAKEQIMTVQLNDALDMPVQALLGTKHRYYPGSGIFNVAGFCEAVLSLGYDGPFTVEIMNSQLWSKPAEEICRKAFDACVSVLSQASGIAPSEARITN